MINKDFNSKLKKYRKRLNNSSGFSEFGISRKVAGKIHEYVLNPRNEEELECANGYLDYVEEAGSMIAKCQQEYFDDALDLFLNFDEEDEEEIEEAELDEEDIAHIMDNIDYIDYAKKIYFLKKDKSKNVREEISDYVATPEHLATIIYQSCRVPSDDLELTFTDYFGIDEDDKDLKSTIKDIGNLTISLQDNFFDDIKNTIAFFNKFDKLYQADKQKSKDNYQYKK